MTVPDVSVLLVTYNSKAFVDRCLESLRDGAGCSYEVIVADNDSADGTVAHCNAGEIETFCWPAEGTTSVDTRFGALNVLSL